MRNAFAVHANDVNSTMLCVNRLALHRTLYLLFNTLQQVTLQLGARVVYLRAQTLVQLWMHLHLHAQSEYCPVRVVQCS
jgi:hypothetical protein